MTTKAVEKVIFADDVATIHILDGDVVEYPDGSKFEPTYSKVLLPGDTVALSEVPSYLREAVEKGEAPCLSLRTPAAAKKLVNQAKKMKGSVTDIANSQVFEDEE